MYCAPAATVVVGPAVGVGIHVAAVVASARRVLERYVTARTVAAVGRRVVEREAPLVDGVAGLLGHHRLVGLQVESVAAAAVLLDVVVLGHETRVGARAEVGAHAQRLRLQLGQLGEAVAVAVVARAVAHLSEETHAGAPARRDERGVEHRGVVVGAAAADRGERVRKLRRVVERLARDDIDRAADGRRTVERRAAAAQHLDPLDHVGGDLLQSVDAREGREDGVRVDQNLRVVAVEAVDAHLGEAAVLAVVLHAHAGLERESLRQRHGVGPLEQIGAHDAHQRRRLALERLGAAGRDDHLVHREALLVDLEILLEAPARRKAHLPPLRGVAQRADLEHEVAHGEVFQKVVARGVGRGAVGGAHHGDRGVGEMLAGRAVDHMAVDVGVGVLLGGLFAPRTDKGQAHEERLQQIFFHDVGIRLT